MKFSTRCASILVCSLFWSLRAVVADPAPPVLPTIPASLAVPAGQEPVLVLKARGAQIYECRAATDAPDKFEWVFKAPEAELFDTQGRKVGRHYAGPTWELTAGGKVVGKVKAKLDAPDGKGVPWLLVDVTDTAGGGVMGKILTIQRIDTVGGKSPAEAADKSKIGQERRVEYTATYVFNAGRP